MIIYEVILLPLFFSAPVQASQEQDQFDAGVPRVLSKGGKEATEDKGQEHPKGKLLNDDFIFLENFNSISFA